MHQATSGKSNPSRAAAFADREALLLELAEDTGAKRRHEIAATATVLIHAVVIAMFLLAPQVRKPAPETVIPVEVVTLAPDEPEEKPGPEKKPEPEAAESEPAPPPPQEQNVGESGGDPDLAPGKKELAAAPRPTPLPEPKPAPPKSDAPAAETSAPDTELSLFDKPEPSAIPFTPPPTPPEAERQAALQSGESDALVNPSMLTGEGGGDPYLNALRDSVIKHLIFPASSELVGVSGTAQYQIIVDRQGHLLEAELVSSAGNPTLDRVGLNSIKRAAPFDPLPDRITGENVGILVVLFMKPFS